MPIPWSTTTISTTPSLSRTVVPTPIRVPASEYATALSRRLRTTVTSRSWSPSTTAGSPPTSMVMSLAVGPTRELQLGFPDLPVTGNADQHVVQLGVHHPITAHQVVRVRRRAGSDHPAVHRGHDGGGP